MLSDDEKFEKLIREELVESKDESYTVPLWFIGVLCYALPASILLPMGLATGDMFTPLIFSSLIGTGFFFYARHLNVINSFVKQDKPLKTVFRDFKQQEQNQLQTAKNNAPDALVGTDGKLSEFEEEHWTAFMSGLDLDSTDVKKKRRGWKKR